MDERFKLYQALLLEWNARVNLTAITDEAGIRVKHFEDSLTALPFIPQGAAVIDVGSGAGFPGVPIAIARADVTITLLEATGKRAAFLREAVSRLGLGNAAVVQTRAEEAGRAEYRGRFDIAIARAVAEAPALVELCLPFVRVGGAFLAMKGGGAADEFEAAKPLIAAMGGAVRVVTPLALSDGAARAIVSVAKQGETPGRYPRRASRIGRGM